MLGKKKQVARNALGAALVFMFAAVPGAFADDGKGWYLGAGLGQSKIDINEGAINAAVTGFTTVSTTSDEKGDAWKLFGGYQFTKNWAVEFAYIDTGKVSADTTATGPAGQFKFEWAGKGWSLAGVGTAMVSDSLGVFGKLGAFSWDLDYKCSKVSGTGTCTAPADRGASGTDLTYGLGLKYNLTKQTSLRVEWEQFKDVGNASTTGQEDISLISIGIQYKL